MKRFARDVQGVFERLQQNARESSLAPLEGTKPKTERVIDTPLVSQRWHHLEKLADQINGTYEHGWYDACAVMLRRFIETLIIETYIAKGAEAVIKKSDGDFYSLKRLIDIACNGNHLHLSRDTKGSLRKLKKLGDRSAHNRRFIAKRSYIESLFEDLFLDMQTLIQEFILEADSR